MTEVMTPRSVAKPTRAYDDAFTALADIEGRASSSKVNKRLLEVEAEAAALTNDVGAEPKPRWERLPSGTALSVWWSGSEDYFECKILDWRVKYNDDGQLVYSHRCQ